jgi:hypothetical protein
LPCRLAERVLDWLGVSVTHIRPTFFAEWILNVAPMVRAGVVRLPLLPTRDGWSNRVQLFLDLIVTSARRQHQDQPCPKDIARWQHAGNAIRGVLRFLPETV